MADAPMINATQPHACDGGVSDRGMREITASRMRTGGLPRAVSVRPFKRLAQTSRWGWGGCLKTAAANHLNKFQNTIVTHFVCEVNQ